MNPPVTEFLRAAVSSALAAVGIERAPQDLHLERTSRPDHGDWFSNVAMVEARPAGRNPRELAAELAERMEKDPPRHLDRIQVAGPGFLNFHLAPGWLTDALLVALEQSVEGYARPDLGKGERVQIEFVSANPTGPLHVGNGWLCSFGETLARLMRRCGYRVATEYYVNDTGGQIRLLGESLLAHLTGDAVPDQGYQGAYVGELAARYPGDPGDEVATAGRWAAEQILANIRSSMERLSIHFDEWFSQASIEDGGAVAETIALLVEKGLVYQKEGATWLASTQVGDSRDRVLIKANGDATYLGGDIAYHRNKFLVRGFDRVIDVFGADHHGQVASLKAAVTALGVDPDRLEIHLGQMVSLAGGTMSKRAGNFVSLDSLLDDIGDDAFRLLSLTKSINESTVLDLDLVRAQTAENPVYYVQYAHARISSIGRVAAERGVVPLPPDEVDLSLLVHPRELEMMRVLEELPDVVVDACQRREPFKITNWVRKLADRFHGFYHDCYVMGEGVSPALTQARLALVQGARVGFAIGLELLGVTAPESM